MERPLGGGEAMRNLGASPRDRRLLGIILALGAALGAAAGAVIGIAAGDIGHWLWAGIPAGISFGLAAGAVFIEPTHREPFSRSPSVPRMDMLDDGPAGPPPLPQQAQSRRSPTAAA
jgi:hypothetical protein